MRFEATLLDAREVALRDEVRSFLARELLPGTYRPGLGLVAEHSPEFTAKLAGQGWIGMAIPKRYGGHDRTQVERFVVLEELLAAGAPIAAHWVADRQTAPMLLRFGTEAQRERFLPAIAAGRLWFSLGMSEPDCGSDLAAVRTRASRTAGGWTLNGTKLWTTGAQHNHFIVVLCRTSAANGDRHAGLSQLIVDLHADGVLVRPIASLDGAAHFNEVVFSDVFVPDDLVLGETGDGWRQVTTELASERASPDRYLSTFPVLRAFLEAYGEGLGPDAAADVAGLIAGYRSIRHMALSVARLLDRGEVPTVEGVMVKDLGTQLEQAVVDVLRRLADVEVAPAPSGAFEALQAYAVLTTPMATVRGGTSEILRTVMARELLRR